MNLSYNPNVSAAHRTTLVARTPVPQRMLGIEPHQDHQPTGSRVEQGVPSSLTAPRCALGCTRKKMTRLSGHGYNSIYAWGEPTTDTAPEMASLGVTHDAPASAGASVPWAVPRIYLVGNMRALAPDGADFLPRGRKTRGLLACLCLAQGERVSRGRLVGLLWDRSADAQARMSLRGSLSELNSIVNRHVPGLVGIGRDSVQIDVGKCWIDALAIIEAGADATADTSNLVHPYSERLLEDLDGITPSFDQWLTAERTRFEDRVRKILEAELDRLIEQNARPEVRAAAARRLINFEPTHEGAARSLMTAFAQLGDRPQAIREFERCRRVLLTVLDLPPSKETVGVYKSIRTESPKWVSLRAWRDLQATR